MTESKTLEIEGMRYTIRGLIFEELVQLGQSGLEGKDGQTVVKEIAQCCLVAPKASLNDNRLNDEVLTKIAREVLKMT